MILFDFKCKICGKVEERILKVHDELQFCPCRGVMKKLFSGDSANIIIFKAEYYDNIGPVPIFIESRDQLREECKKHGGISRYLEDGYNR